MKKINLLSKSFSYSIKLFRQLSLFKKVILVLFITGFSLFFFQKIFVSFPQKQTQYQTTKAEKGDLIVTVSASGQVTQANSAVVETRASGVVKKIFVTNGQRVKTGDKIAELELDLIGQERASSAFSSYQSARNNLETAKINYYTLRSEMLTRWKAFMDIAQSPIYENPDKSPNISNRQLPEFLSTDDEWRAAEAKYKQQANVVAQAETALRAAWLNYQQTSPIIYAPISGTITGFSLQEGSILSAQSNTSGSAASQKIASIKTEASPIISVNLSQIDIAKVAVGNKATIVFDAFPDKTFTGKIISIDTIGTVNSGVVTYLATIKLDTEEEKIYPNMTVTANIITQVKNNAIILPLNAVRTENGQKFVRILKDGKINEVEVETGISSANQIEILSGVREGDEVVTNIISISRSGQRGSQVQSPFAGFGGGFRIR